MTAELLLLLFVFHLLPSEPVVAFFVPGSRPPQASPKPLRVSTTDAAGAGQQPPPADARADGADSSKRKDDVRPLTQNWWPVSLASALDRRKPNPVELLGRKLVLWRDDAEDGGGGGGGGGWSCLDDRCAHRFAPLSEGRIVVRGGASGEASRLQCAYHGWEFGAAGDCARIPQASDDRAECAARCSVQNYPVKEAAGMVFVWADPTIDPDEGRDPSHYVSNLLSRFHDAGGTARGFQRDLPYGLEYLGENLADISHLPFSHHSVGTLNREDGRPVPLEMLSAAEKVETAKLQNNPIDNLPFSQTRVVNAAEHDPEIVAARKYNPDVRARADPELASSTIGFFDPCHIRYHRNQGIPGSSYEINLFMCPTTEGNSRVFLFTPFEKMLPQEGEEDDATKKTYQPSALMRRSANKLFGKAKPSFPPHIGHMIAHSIFDGDGIFLNKQGDRMRRAKLTYKDYRTPTSADLLVNAFRRWLDKAAEATRSAGEEREADAATGGRDGSAYDDVRPRAALLDRYASHTARCEICSAALEGLRAERDRLSLLHTALVGATGASGVLLLCSSVVLAAARILLGEAKSAIWGGAVVSLFAATAGSWAGAKEASKRKAKLDKEIQGFYFEDYVHAEKD